MLSVGSKIALTDEGALEYPDVQLKECVIYIFTASRCFVGPAETLDIFNKIGYHEFTEEQQSKCHWISNDFLVNS